MPEDQSGPGSKTRRVYLERVNRVLEYIDQNLHAELRLEVLARVANFSPYHIHRIFQAVVGESAQNHIKQIRLAAAARKLPRNCPSPRSPWTAGFLLLPTSPGLSMAVTV